MSKTNNSLNTAKFKHVVLGLIFLKYISDSFTKLYDKLINGGKLDNISMIPAWSMVCSSRYGRYDWQKT